MAHLLAMLEHIAPRLRLRELQQNITLIIPDIAVRVMQNLPFGSLNHHDTSTFQGKGAYLPCKVITLIHVFKVNGVINGTLGNLERLRDKLAVFLLNVNVFFHNLTYFNSFIFTNFIAKFQIEQHGYRIYHAQSPSRGFP